IVTMRLTSVKGRPVESILADKTNHISHWALRHEYRSTFNDHLRDGEKIVAGQWQSRAVNDAKFVPISVEEGLAKELHVGVGDEMDFDVQGVPVDGRIASLRQV